ncbi:MAG TPA: hypothetical protein ENJ70_00955 [Thermoplasmatales archaeon]|nr:hypothetical protein [Thermoplasmatales archaeon]
MNKQAMCLLLVAGFLISSIASFTERERNPTLLESGDCIEVEGRISNVTYINTSYGKIPLLQLPSFTDVLKSKGMWSPDIYKWGGMNAGNIIFDIMGKIDGEYHVGDDFNITLHFQKISFDGIELYWFKEIPLHVVLLLSIQNVLEYSINSHYNLFLVEKERDADSISYEIAFGSKRVFDINSVNISIRKFEMNKSYNDGITFPEAFEKIMTSLATIYVAISGLEYSHLPLVDSFHDGVSDKNLIEIVDANRNALLDSGDILKVKIPPTANDTIMESYFITLDAPQINQTILLKIFLNWYHGPIEITDKIALVAEKIKQEEKNDFMNISIEIGPTLPPAGIPYDELRIETDVNHSSHKSANIPENLSSVVLNNISIKFIDANNNSLLDTRDLIEANGIPRGNPVTIYLVHRKENTVLLRWEREE